jgi:hypothetical protein
MLSKKFPKGIFALPENVPVSEQNVCQILNDQDRIELEAQARINNIVRPQIQINDEQLRLEQDALIDELYASGNGRGVIRNRRRCLVM